MRAIAFALFMTFAATAAHANDWEKFYRPIEASGSLIPATQEPEIITSAVMQSKTWKPCGDGVLLQ
ncbi:MAG: hypothetical protein IPK89_09970 [Sphingomonadales bacterium]|nr:hypothetical protein [Sphingomonadales bacterium]